MKKSRQGRHIRQFISRRMGKMISCGEESLLTELEILGDEFLQRWRTDGAAEYPEGITSFSPALP